MNYLLVSDIHATSKQPKARIDDIVSVSKDKVTQIVKLAKKHNAVILQAGDISNTARDFEILYHLLNILRKYRVEFYAVRGQHDYYHRTRKPSISSILESTGLIRILTGEPRTIGEYNVYGTSWKCPIPKPEKSLPSILVCHSPISDKQVPGSKFSAKKFIRENRFDLILCGDIHRQFTITQDKRVIANTGPIVRRNSDERNHRPAVFLFSGHDGLRKIELKHKGRKAFSISHQRRERRIKTMVEEFAGELDYKPTDALDALELVDNIAEELGQGVVDAIQEIKEYERQ